MRLGAAFGLAAVVLGVGCAHRTPAMVQREHLESITPDAPTSEVGVGPATTHATIRVYADQVMAGLPSWEPQLRDIIARANDVLRGRFGLVLKVESVRPYERTAADNSLQAILAEIEQRDAGDETDWVVAFVTPTSAAQTSHHQLGMARVTGRHLVLRGMDDLAELEALDTLTALSASERADAYQARKKHKEATIFLHEWGHTLGALHTRDQRHFMCPDYDHRSQRFAEPNEVLIKLGLKERQHKSAEALAKWQQKIHEFVNGSDWDGWDPRAVAALNAEAGQPPADDAPKTTWLSQEHVDAFNQAVKLVNAEQLSDAAMALDALLTVYVTSAEVQGLASHIFGKRALTVAAARIYCGRTASLDPGSYTAHLSLMQAELDAGEIAAGKTAARAALECMQGAEDVDPQNWRYLMGVAYNHKWRDVALVVTAQLPDDPDAKQVRRWAKGRP